MTHGRAQPAASPSAGDCKAQPSAAASPRKRRPRFVL